MDSGKLILSAQDLVTCGIKPTVPAVRTAYARIRRGELPVSAMPPLLGIPGNRNIQVARDALASWVALFSGAVILPHPLGAPASSGGRRGRPPGIEAAKAKHQGITVTELRRLEFMAQRAGK